MYTSLTYISCVCLFVNLVVDDEILFLFTNAHLSCTQLSYCVDTLPLHHQIFPPTFLPFILRIDHLLLFSSHGIKPNDVFPIDSLVAITLS